MVKNILREAPIRFSEIGKITKSSKSVTGDDLNIFPYAKALTKIIEECETPLTIGVQGDWGSGKTTLLNMIRGDEHRPGSGLMTGTTCCIVNFETWSYAQFNQDEILPLACLYALTRKVDQALDAKGLREQSKEPGAVSAAANRLLGVLKNIKVQNVSVAGVGINLSDDSEGDTFNYCDVPEQMIEFRREFEDLIGEWTKGEEKRRVVIFIDDLDRIKPIRALEMLEAIKNFLDVDGCVFVLAVDYEIIQQGMIQKLGEDIQKTSGKSFFDKIIQLPFCMPSASYDMEAYVMALVQESGLPYISDNTNSRTFFKEITLFTVGPNPRSIKRVANYVKLLAEIRIQSASRDQKTTGQQSMILYALICMQIAWPELFSYFCKNPTSDTISNLEDWEFLDKLPEAKKLFDRVHDIDATKNNISAFLDRFIELIDENQDGTISEEEMVPVLTVLQMSKLTSILTKERPRDFIANQAVKLGADKNLIRNVFQKSLWHTSTDLQYRKSGNRYVTLVWNRRQLGTIVSLKSRPFIIRLVIRAEDIQSKIGEGEGPFTDISNLESIIRPLNENEYNLTGLGGTVIDRTELMKLDQAKAIELLNAIFFASTKLIESGDH